MKFNYIYYFTSTWSAKYFAEQVKDVQVIAEGHNAYCNKITSSSNEIAKKLKGTLNEYENGTYKEKTMLIGTFFD